MGSVNDPHFDDPLPLDPKAYETEVIDVRWFVDSAVKLYMRNEASGEFSYKVLPSAKISCDGYDPVPTKDLIKWWMRNKKSSRIMVRLVWDSDDLTQNVKEAHFTRVAKDE